MLNLEEIVRLKRTFNMLSEQISLGDEDSLRNAKALINVETSSLERLYKKAVRDRNELNGPDGSR